MEEAWRLFRVCPSVALLCLIDCCTCVCLAVMSNESAGLLGRGYAGDAAGLLFPFPRQMMVTLLLDAMFLLACLLAYGPRTSQIEPAAKPEKGGGTGSLELEELEHRLDFPFPACTCTCGVVGRMGTIQGQSFHPAAQQQCSSKWRGAIDLG